MRIRNKILTIKEKEFQQYKNARYKNRNSSNKEILRILEKELQERKGSTEIPKKGFQQ